MGKQYWADASTQNCIWMFQVKHKYYGDDGCNCGAWNHEEGCAVEDKKCDCGFEYWQTEAIYLAREEAREHGKARPYAWGKENEGWRIFGVPAHGIMVDLLGQHNEEFKDKVEYISEYRKVGTISMCKNVEFNGIDCLENDKQFGFFKSDNDIRPSSCTWVNKEDVIKLWEIFEIKLKEKKE